MAYELGRKTCSRCKKKKPYSEFYKRRNRSHGLMSVCKTCDWERRTEPDAVYKKNWYEAHRAELFDRDRFRRFGITRAEYDAMLVAQQGLCAICSQPERSLNKRGEIREMAVDHDHVGGRVRALLCSKCNVGLGYFGDNLALLRHAIEYLEAHSVASSEISEEATS